MVTRMVSWHWALYRAFFRVPWRALVLVPPSQAPQLSNLYLQSAGGRVPRVRAGQPVASLYSSAQVSVRPRPSFLPSACTPPHLQTPFSSCRAPYTGCAESGSRRHPRGTPHRSPCCWGCRAPRSTPRTHLRGHPSSLCLQRTRTELRTRDTEIHSVTPPLGSRSPNPGSQPQECWSHLPVSSPLSTSHMPYHLFFWPPLR